MKRKHIYVLAAVFLTLLAVNAIQKTQSSKSVSGVVHREEWQPQISEEKVARILFSRPGFSNLALVKEGKDWKVESLSGVSANTQNVKTLLTQLNQMKAELRAEGDGLYERFGISDANAFRIQIFDAGSQALVDFFMGSQRSGQGVFIRLNGKAKIYFTPDDIPALFGLFSGLDHVGPEPLFFADLRLVPEAFEQIQRFETAEYQDGKKIDLAVLERPSTVAGTPWKFLSPAWKFSVDPEKVEEYLTRITGAHAENITTDVTDFKIAYEIMLRDARGKVLRLEFSKAEKGWLARRENSKVVFEVSKPTFEDFRTQDARFTEKNPLHFQIDDESTVELIHGSKTETFSKASGWPSAAAILDAASRLSFLSVVREVSAKDLSILPPTHQLRVTRAGSPAIEISFYVTDPKQTEIKSVISGQDFVFVVSRDFFESIFVPATPPKEEKLTQ